MMTRLLVCLSMFLGVSEFASAQGVFAGAEEALANAEIERKLDQKRDMVFEDATLGDFATFLEANGIPTHVDSRALEDMGVRSDSQFTFRQQGIRLRDGIRFVLDSLDVTATPRHGRLVISTVEEDEVRLITRTYDVRNLIELVAVPYGGGLFSGGPPQIVYHYNFNSLVELITSSIVPDSWDDVGGPGSIEPYYTRRMRVLVISQTYDIHRQTQTLLDELAVHGGSTPLPGPPPPAPPSRRAERPGTLVNSSVTPPLRRHAEIRSSQLRTTGQ